MKTLWLLAPWLVLGGVAAAASGAVFWLLGPLYPWPVNKPSLLIIALGLLWIGSQWLIGQWNRGVEANARRR